MGRPRLIRPAWPGWLHYLQRYCRLGSPVRGGPAGLMLNGSAVDTDRAAPAVDIGVATETAVTLCYSARHSTRHRTTPPIVDTIVSNR